MNLVLRLAAEVEVGERPQDVAIDAADQLGQLGMHRREGDGERNPPPAEAAAAGAGLDDLRRHFQGFPDFQVEVGLPAEDLRVPRGRRCGGV